MASEDEAEGPVVISERTAKFLSNLHGYLDTRKQMDAMYEEEEKADRRTLRVGRMR